RDGKVLLRDLDSDSGTYLNDERIDSERLIRAGDRLRVGRLEFEALIELPAPSKKADAVDDFVSDMLAQADEEERATRMAAPELRQFHLDANNTNPESAEPEDEDRLTALRKKLPEKKPPGKLPPKPSITAESSVSAAEQTLEKLLKPKPKRPSV
ncbi:MAG TPA: FHA domain-containing protein, partial [Pirellulaceae bacterium]|nr:FHA domain-containing protein [Pirellulaceae bacterium]